ncbi:MAG: hypothetical protein ABIV48_07775 [Pyrinomonadaceae bacterium]
MTENHYQEVPTISREDAETAFSSGVAERICDALVRVTFNDSDWRWVQERCLFLINSSDPEVRGLAVTCLGHLARIHKNLDLNKVLPILENLRSNADIGGKVEDALDDIETFVSN